MASPQARPPWADPLLVALSTSPNNHAHLMHFPGSPEFADSETGYFTAQANEVQSAAIARPTSAADVSILMAAFRKHLPPTVPIAIRGAGNATFAGAAKARGGVTIDMRGLRGITIHPGNESSNGTVRISAGHEWHEVYAALEAHSPPLAVAGGRSAIVGVIGFLLGGGISYFSSRTGFGADSVRAWEVVLASGEVVRAARDDERTADLWDALRGGSTNFGVVTAVEMDVFAHPANFRAGMAFYLSVSRRQTLKALVEFGEKGARAEGDAVSHAFWSITHVAWVPVKIINVMMTTTAGEGQGQGGLGGFLSTRGRVPLTGSLRKKTQGQFSNEIAGLAPKDGSRSMHKSITIKLNAELLNTAVDKWYDFVSSTRHVPGILNTLVFILLPTSMLEASRNTTSASALSSSNPITTTSQGLHPEDGPLVVAEICLTWRNAADDTFLAEATTKFLSDVSNAARQAGLHHRFIFPNYAWPDEMVMQSYGEERREVLRGVAKKWDPEGFFQTRAVGGFKITAGENNLEVMA